MVLRNTGSKPVHLVGDLLLNGKSLADHYVDFETAAWDARGVVWSRIGPSTDLRQRAESAAATLAPLLERSTWRVSRAIEPRPSSSDGVLPVVTLTSEQRRDLESIDAELSPLLADSIGPPALGRAVGASRVLLGDDARARRPLLIAMTTENEEGQVEVREALAALVRRGGERESDEAERRFAEGVARAVLAGRVRPQGGVANPE